MHAKPLILAIVICAAGVAAVAPPPMPGRALAAQAKADPAKAIAALEARVASLEATVSRLTSTISVSNSGNVTITAARLKVNAPQLEVTSPVATFGGTIKGATLSVDSVVAKSYTPGAGNVW
jgi:hypothetical protein